MLIPFAAGIPSDATMIGTTDLDSSVHQLLFQDISPANFTNFGAAWAEVDSGSNVNVDGSGVLSITGNNTWTANGMIGPALTRAEGYLEWQEQTPSSIASALLPGFNSSAALPVGANSGICGSYISALSIGGYVGTTVVIGGAAVIAAATYYTIRAYVFKQNDGATFKRYKYTISGGVFTSETLLGYAENMSVALSNPFYPFFMAYAAGAARLVKLPKWYSGYSTSGPYVDYFADAGAGKVFDNFDLTNLAINAGITTSGRLYKWLFADDQVSFSANYVSLATLNGLGKQTGRHRYIGIRVQMVSDGPTQVYSAELNATTGTDGIGDFPVVGNVLIGATVQGANGTSANLTAADTVFLSLEAGRNSGAAVAKIVTGQSIVQKGTTYNGSASGAESSAFLGGHILRRDV